MGGALATMIILKTESGNMIKPFTGMILSAPALKPHPDVATPFRIWVVKTFARLLPKLPIAELGAANVCSDPLVIRRYSEDSMVCCVYRAFASHESLISVFVLGL